MSSEAGFNQRLREYILKKHGSVNAFCRATGIKYPAQMTPYLMGKCLPGKKMIERLEKDGADIRWLQSGHVNSTARAPLSNMLALSRYRMDIDNLFRQVHLHLGGTVELNKPAIDAYAVIDYNERIVDLTGSIEKFLGYEKSVLSGVELAQLIHPDDYAPVKSALQVQRFEDDIVSFHSRFKQGDGSYLTVEWSLYIKRIPMSDLNEYAMILRKSGS
jgi:PAS domain S-box-containing protein